jgi:hypothetical protein
MSRTFMTIGGRAAAAGPSNRDEAIAACVNFILTDFQSLCSLDQLVIELIAGRRAQAGIRDRLSRCDVVGRLAVNSASARAVGYSKTFWPCGDVWKCCF